jgi:DNA-binding NarL/FixJ family response regulator
VTHRGASIANPRLSVKLRRVQIETQPLEGAGLSNAEIARELFLSVGTVKRHLSNISNRLDASSRTGAVARARELGLL